MSYTIRIDDDRPLLRLTLTGFWGPDVFTRFAADFQAAVRDISRTNRHFDTFVDASGFQVQTMDVAQGFDFSRAWRSRPAQRRAPRSSSTARW